MCGVSAYAGYDQVAFRKNLEYLTSNIYPTISKTAFGWTCFDFKWDFAGGKAIPVEAENELFDEFAGTELSGLHKSPSLDRSPFGSVWIKSSWWMGNYRKCM